MDDIFVWQSAKVKNRRTLGIMDDSANLWQEKRNWKYCDHGLAIVQFMEQKKFAKYNKVVYLAADKEAEDEAEVFRTLLELKELSRENITVFAWCQLCSFLITNNDVQAANKHFKKMGRFLHTCSGCEQDYFPSLSRGKLDTNISSLSTSFTT